MSLSQRNTWELLQVSYCDVFAQLMMQVLLVLYLYRAILNYGLLLHPMLARSCCTVQEEII